MQNTKSKPRNNTSFDVSSSAVPQSELSTKDTATEPSHFSASQSQYTAMDGPEVDPLEHLPMSTTSHAGRPSNRTGSSLRESSIGHRHAPLRCQKNTADIHTASPTVAPQIGGVLVTLHRMTKPEEIRARALMPSNSKPCRSGAPFSCR